MHDWLAHLPEGLTESDLTDMVEGTLPAEREAAAVAALRAEPRLGLLIKQMRADRDSLAGLPPEPAARGLDDDVLAALDDHALREVAAQESAVTPEHLPVSTMRIEDYRRGRSGADGRLVKVAALAAAFAIVAGSAVYLARELRPAPGRPAPATLASNTPPAPTPTPTGLSEPKPVEMKLAAKSESAPPWPSAALADSSGDSPPPTESVAVAQSLAAGASAPPHATSPQPPPASSPPPPTAATESAISPAAAARMARDGRLALVVRPRDPRGTIKRLEAMVRGGAQTTSPGHVLVWHSMAIDRLPPSLARLTSQINAAARRHADARRPAAANETPATVASEGPGRVAGPAPQTLPETSTGPAVQSVFSVEVDPSQRALGDLVQLLGEDGANQILYRVAETAMSPTISLEPEAVLWWTGPPNRWVRPAVVPIIIDARE